MKGSRTTLTVQQACQMFRDAEISISLDAMKRGLIDRRFPFGVAIQLEQWVFIIYRKPLLEYLRSVGADVEGDALKIQNKTEEVRNEQ